MKKIIEKICSHAKEIIKEFYHYLIILVIVLIVKTYLWAPIIVVGSSMKSTLLDGDLMILDKIGYRLNSIERFDIVVIKHNNKLIIKRVIGLPTDYIEYRDNQLYINGQEYDEPFLKDQQQTFDFTLEEKTGLDIIPEGYYFVLGDNREASSDSRVIGLIKESQIEGFAKYTIFPFSRFGKKQ